jgi:hypothetical protein
MREEGDKWLSSVYVYVSYPSGVYKIRLLGRQNQNKRGSIFRKGISAEFQPGFYFGSF